MSVRPAPAVSRLTVTAMFGLAAIALLSYLDWITHRDAVTAIVLAVVAGGAMLFRAEIVERAGLRPVLSQIPRWAKPILAASPAVLYFLVRGQGTSGAGGVVLVSMGLTVGAVALLGPAIDAKLEGFYAARNRILPVAVRLALALVLPILVAFLVIHGSLADLPAMFGGTTNHPMSPSGREGMFLLGTLLSSAIAYLLVRDPGAAGEPATAAEPGTPSVPAATWIPTHAVPPGGMTAWAAPDPAGAPSAMLDPGLPLQVVAVAGDWAQVRASNGWVGWVDGRRLLRAGS